MSSYRTPSLEALNDHIIQAFQPKPLECRLNGKLYYIERITAGWCWRNEDGDTQEVFGIIEPFATATEAQQSAIDHVKGQSLNALYLRREELWRSQPRINLAASQNERQAYKVREEKWLADMSEVDGLIAAARKGAV
jgi:hypothetical protein